MNNERFSLEDLQNKDVENCYTALLSYLNAVPLGNARPCAFGKLWVELVGVLDIDGLPFEIIMSIEDYKFIVVLEDLKQVLIFRY